MSQVLAAAIAAAFIFYAMRWVSRDIARVEAALRRIQRRLLSADAVSATVLHADPSTGVYRPAD